MQPVTTYQKGEKFVVTRVSERTELDAEEFLRHLNQAREQLKAMEKGIEEFRRDVERLEKLESVAKSIRNDELEKAKKERVGLG